MLAVISVVACDVDDRGLSFSLNALGSASSGGTGEPEAGEGNTPQGGVPGGGGADGGGSGGTDSPTGGRNSIPEGGAPPSTAGSSNVMGGVDPGPKPSQGGAADGAAGMPPVVEDPEPGNFPCGNLNRNAVDDCQETLVGNSRFDTSASSWANEGASVLTETWKQEDARGNAGSGSLLLANTNVIANGTGTTGVAAYQCITAWTGDSFEVGARVRVASGQGEGEAGVNLMFFGGDACAGQLLGGENVAFTSKTDQWSVVKNTSQIPAGTRSMRVRLMVSKPFSQASFEAQFDDVLVVKL
jgi:hypothetical protein